MKKIFIGLVIIAVIVTTILFLLPGGTEPEVEQEVMEFPEPAPGAVVFDMKYRGLSGEKDDLRDNS